MRNMHVAPGWRAAIGLCVGGSGVALALLGCESIIDADFDVTVVSCTHAAPPAPTPLAGSAGGDVVLTFAAGDIDLGESDDPNVRPFLEFGFDLDGKCTGRSERHTCRGHAWTEPIEDDGIDGRDNALGWLMFQQNATFGRTVFRSDTLSAGIRDGAIAPMAVFRISAYNNRSDDDQVRVEWFVPAAPMKGETFPHDWDDPTAKVPLDVARHDQGQGGAAVARVVDEHAYVTGHQLVAHFTNGPVLQLANGQWSLTDAVLVAPIDQDGVTSRPGDVATLAGRASEAELLRRLPDVTAAVAGIPICRNDPTYPISKKFSCSVLDLRLAGDDPSQACDALSFGLRFHARSVTLGPLQPSRPAETCPPGEEPASDPCAVPATPAGPTVEVDAGSDAGTVNCVPPGTPNNAVGIGGYCEQGSDCPDSFCSATVGAPKGAWFCTNVCNEDAHCQDPNIACVADGAGRKGCVPKVCAPPPPPDGGAPDGG